MIKRSAPSLATLLICLGVTTAGSGNAYAEDTKPYQGTSAFMRAKLASSQKVIEGLVSEDFAMIRRAAHEMKLMSEATQWPTADDATYQHFRAAFGRECEQLARLAESENLMGAHYTYLQLTTTCINCHNHVRKSFRVTPDKDNPQGPVILIPNEWEGSSRPPSPGTTEAKYRREVRPRQGD